MVQESVGEAHSCMVGVWVDNSARVERSGGRLLADGQVGEIPCLTEDTRRRLFRRESSRSLGRLGGFEGDPNVDPTAMHRV